MEKRANLSNHMEGFEEPIVDYKKYETSFRRWLVSEIELGYMTVAQARDRFSLPKHFHVLYKVWQQKYSSKIHVSLSLMTAEEQIEHEKLQRRIKELENLLDRSQKKNVLLESILDIAEKEFKLELRKKAGPKQ